VLNNKGKQGKTQKPLMSLKLTTDHCDEDTLIKHQSLSEPI